MQELIASLVSAQKEMSHAKASATNPAFKSLYVPYEQLMDYVKEHLNKHGIFIQQVSHETEGGMCVETILHGHGSSLSSGKVFVKADKQTTQGYGSALTYARRYSLSLATGSGADKDDDGNQAEKDHRAAKPAATKPAPAKQPPAAAPDGSYAVKKGNTIIVTAGTPDAFLGMCREYMGLPDDGVCKEIYRSSYDSIVRAKNNCKGSTHEALATLISVYGGPPANE
tara:strand:- start:5789 stop:6466 length:678 start_codon:yes stop_codon:yes gene_type:complete